MMSAFSQVVWLLLCVCTAVTAGHVSTATTPSLPGGKPASGRLQRMEQMLISLQQRHSPCTGSSKQLLRLKHDLSLMRTKLEATEVKMEAKLEATETKQEATEAKLEVTERKLEATERKLEATETKQEATERKLEVVEAELRSTRAMIRSNMKSGSTFVRWGRKTCTNETQLVYSGVAGGSHFTHPGAAANLLCLTMSPQFDHIKARYYAYLYGAEYERIPNHHNQDVPCSVCHAPQSATIMIPATRSCPTGWTTQYAGHLVAGWYNQKAASEYVCLDGDPEHMVNGHLNHNGNLLYYTFTQCGSLPCPPYSNNAVVICVVCSK